MAIAISTLLTAAGTTTDATSFTTASQSPSADRLLIASIGSSVSTGQADIPTVTGNGLTWTRVAGTAHSTNYRLNIFLALTGASTPSSGALTIDFGSQTQTSCLWHVAEVSGAFMGGSSLESVLQANNQNAGSSVTTLNATLTAVYQAGDLNFAAIHRAGNTTTTAERTSLGDTGVGTPAARLAVQYFVDDDSTLNWTWTTGSNGSASQLRILAAENWSESSRSVIVANGAAVHRASRW